MTDKDKTTFDVAALDAADEAHMEVRAGDKPTGWIWTFAGPGHPRAEAQNNRVAREQLDLRRAQQQAQVNGKKWKAPEQSPDELLAGNVDFVLERLLRWSSVTMDGQDYPFTADNARKLLMDRKKGALLQQAIDFVIDDNSFTRRSATN